MEEIKVNKQMLPSVIEMNKPVVKVMIDLLEYKLSHIQGEGKKKIIDEECEKMNNKEGQFDSVGAWKMKKRLFPNSRDSPAAVLDAHGNLITDSTGIMNRMSEEFSFRLRNREECEGFQELRELKEKLCNLRLDITSHKEYNEWTMKKLEKVLNKLKINTRILELMEKNHCY